MLNFWSVNNCLYNSAWNSLYFGKAKVLRAYSPNIYTVCLDVHRRWGWNIEYVFSNPFWIKVAVSISCKKKKKYINQSQTLSSSIQNKVGSYYCISMTSLFAHKVAQPTKWRFLPKNLSQLVFLWLDLRSLGYEATKIGPNFRK